MGYSVDFISFDCYSDTTVLINKFGIRDEEKSNEVEGVITSARYILTLHITRKSTAFFFP